MANDGISQRAVVATARALLNLPPGMPTTLLDLALETNYSQGHLSKVIRRMIDMRLINQIGSGGCTGFRYELHRDNCARVLGDYIEFEELGAV